jgi:ATP-binding cassette subfamily B (MDR/TAP) protein 1
VIFGQLAGTFQGFIQHTITHSTLSQNISHFTLYFIYLAIGVCHNLYSHRWLYLYWRAHHAEDQEQYLAAILRQNIAFFDKLGAGEITTRITADTNLVQDGISEKMD